ncbi:hypothetical protein [Dactylosporangium sp. NPDC049140]|uniref:hypothetical protein n=1 Tax=Dactylosporangium sp. NPDC049140 TaxID=3155647 RepID=UPI0033F29969
MAMDAMAEGDLSRTVAGAVDRATAGVRQTVAALAGSADLVARSSGQLDDGAAAARGALQKRVILPA